MAGMVLFLLLSMAPTLTVSVSQRAFTRGPISVPLRRSPCGGARPFSSSASLPGPSGPSAVATDPSLLASNASLSYDEQVGETFTESSESLDFVVSAVAQTDSAGYGPAYLLNGLSNAGFWYQVGLSYDWGGSGGGFAMIYEVFSPGGKSVFPLSGSGGLRAFSGPVFPGNWVELRLYFSGDRVVMSARDLETGAYAMTDYGSEGASYFLGLTNSSSNEQGFFTGIMTEEYNAKPYYGPEEAVTYVARGLVLGSAWLWADERDVVNGSTLFQAFTPDPVKLGDWPYPFGANGTVEYANSTSLITGEPEVIPKMRLLSFRFTNGSTVIDQGSSVELGFASFVEGGLPPFNYFITVDGKVMKEFGVDSGGLSYYFNASNPSGSLGASLPVGLHELQVIIMDSDGDSVAGPAFQLKVNPDPSAFLSGKVDYDLGQPLTFSVSVTGGTPPYEETPYANGSPVPPGYWFDGVGRAVVFYRVTDAAGYTVRTNPLEVWVNPDPSGTLTYSRSVTDVGLPVQLNASVTGGTPPYRWEWEVNGTPYPDNSTSFDFVPSSPGIYVVSATVFDSAEFQVEGGRFVTVNPDPSVTVYSLKRSSSDPLLSGNAVTVFVKLSGGTAPVVYLWYLNGRQVANTTSPDYTYEISHAGKEVVKVKAVDALGVSSPPASALVYVGYDVGFLSALAVALAFSAAALFLLFRAKKRPRARSRSTKAGQMTDGRSYLWRTQIAKQSRAEQSKADQTGIEL